jgi:sulfur relay (sulfurtransferase) DsrC/TusE family protein
MATETQMKYEPVRKPAKPKANPAAPLRACLIQLRKRAHEAGRHDEVAMIDAALADDVRASVLARVGPVDMTEKLWEVVELIERHRQELGYSPTLEEMAKVLKISKVTVYERVETLRERGVLSSGTYAHRGLQVATRPPVK